MNFLTQIIKSFPESAKRMRQIRTLTACSMLLALAVVLDYYGSFYPNPTTKISTAFIANAACGMLFGPVPAMMVGGLQDVIVWLFDPHGAFFPGYTISGIIGGIIYGLCLYKCNGKLLYIMPPIAKLLVNLIVNAFLNTYWNAITKGTPFVVLFPGRLLKNVIAWPIESIVLIAVIIFLSKNRKKLLI